MALLALCFFVQEIPAQTIPVFALFVKEKVPNRCARLAASLAEYKRAAELPYDRRAIGPWRTPPCTELLYAATGEAQTNEMRHNLFTLYRGVLLRRVFRLRPLRQCCGLRT